MFNYLLLIFFAEMSFQCLASWQSDTQGETYMSLLDTKLPQLGEEARPRYRCAVSEKFPQYPGFSFCFSDFQKKLCK